MYFVYILKSLKTGQHYIGHTNDLMRRMADHARGKSPSVRGRGPFELVYKEVFSERAAAVKRERKIKSFRGGESFKKLIARNTPLNSLSP